MTRLLLISSFAVLLLGNVATCQLSVTFGDGRYRVTLANLRVQSAMKPERIGPGSAHLEFRYRTAEFFGHTDDGSGAEDAEFGSDGLLYFEASFPSYAGPMYWDLSWEITISVSGYEDAKVTGGNRVQRKLFSSPKFETDLISRAISLRPIKKQIELSGGLVVSPPGGTNGSSDLGVVSAEGLANQLGVSVSAIVKLIESGELAGNLIDGKYFITKESVGAYLNHPVKVGKDSRKGKSVVVQPRAETPKEYVQRLESEAAGCLIAEDWNGALERYREIRRASPNDPRGRNGEQLVVDSIVRRADNLMASSRFTEAAQLYKKAIELKPGDKVLMIKLAKAEGGTSR
jgi:hypothetical protein